MGKARDDVKFVRAARDEYPLCPRCGGLMAGASMTRRAVVVHGVRYYPASALSVYCVKCGHDKPLHTLKTPVPAPETDACNTCEWKKGDCGFECLVD
jgi:NAD-dependent SIR2 family protein deacetylase